MSEYSREDLLRMGELIGLDLVGRNALIYREPLLRLYEEGLPAGSSTGWRSVDRHYTVAPGQLTIITGWPGSGKSEWLDAMLMNLAPRGWRFAIFSPENQPVEIHVVKYLEKFVRKPFGAGPTERMTKEEALEAAAEIVDWFSFITPAFSTERLSFDLDQVLKAAESDFRERKIWSNPEINKGIVIDPWNELEHFRPRDVSETEYIGATLQTLRAWGRKNNVHVFLVAHPQKLKRDDNGVLPVPRPDSINGSQNWWNKADAAITVWRELGENRKDETDVHIWKVRFKHIGTPGKVTLRYDRVTGCYSEPPAELTSIPGGRANVRDF